MTRTHVARYCAAAGLQFTLAFAIASPPPPDLVIEAARKAAAVYVQSLPDYIVKRTTKRYEGFNGGNWHPIDIVAADVAAVHGKEIYTNVTDNGHPVSGLPGGGAWTAGEFSTAMAAILAPQSAAVFTHRHAESINKHASYRYDFAIDQKHSSRYLALDNSPSSVSYAPAYEGQVWLDKGTGQVLRIEMRARIFPAAFPLNATASRIDYDFVKIGGRAYLLPTQAETVMCERSSARYLMNDNLFRNYDKFTADSTIIYGGATK